MKSSRTTLTLATVMTAVPMFLLALPASAQEGRAGGRTASAGGAVAGGSSGGSASSGGMSGGSAVSSPSGGSSGGGGSSSTSGSNTGSSFAGSGSGPSGVRGVMGARDGATGGGGVAVGRAVHGADTSSYRSGGGAAFFSDHTAGRVMATDPTTRNADVGGVPAHSRPRDGASISGIAVPRGSVPMQPTGPTGGYSYINNGSAYGYYGVGGIYGSGFYSCDPYGFNSPMFGPSCGGWYGAAYGYGYAPMYSDPWYATTTMDAFSADPWYGGSGGASSSSTWTPDSPEDATLRLKIKPSQAEVFADGYFVGVVNDFDGMFQKLHLEAGPHRIEIRAAGFETLDLDIKLTSGKTTVYQGELTKIQ